MEYLVPIKVVLKLSNTPRQIINLSFDAKIGENFLNGL